MTSSSVLFEPPLTCVQMRERGEARRDDDGQRRVVRAEVDRFASDGGGQAWFCRTGANNSGCSGSALKKKKKGCSRERKGVCSSLRPSRASARLCRAVRRVKES